MKKSIYLITAAMVLLLASCAKTELAQERDARTIAFQTANYATKVGISGTKFPTSETFGVFAWTAGTTGPYFMDNEVVAFQEDELWKTNTPYVWPLDQTVDFFCFYPAKMTGITVDKTKVNYAFDVEANPVDVMYADKAVAFADYPDRVPGSVSGYDGVPAIFHHALAKLTVDVALAYNHKEEADGTVTDWEVTVNSVKLSGLHMKGACELTLADSPEIGIVGWNKPKGNVWTPDASVMAEKNYIAAATPLKVTAMTAVPEMFVLPQTLTRGGQKIALNITIKTKRNGADFLTETLDVAADFLAPNALQAWEMNHAITYRIKINPTRSNGNGGKPSDDPSNPVDPSNPDLSDAVITFDPAVLGWEMLNVSATINL